MASKGFLDAGKALIDEIHTLMTGSGAIWSVFSTTSGTATYTANRTGSPVNRTYDTQVNIYSRTLGSQIVYFELSNLLVEIEGGSAAPYRDCHLLRVRIGLDVLSAPDWITGYHICVIDQHLDPFPYAVPTFASWTGPSLLKSNTTQVIVGDGPFSLFIGINTETGGGVRQNSQALMLGELVGTTGTLRDFFFTTFKSYADLSSFNTFMAALGSTYEIPTTAAPAGAYIPRTGLFGFDGADIRFLDSTDSLRYKFWLWQRAYYENGIGDGEPEALTDFYASVPNVLYAFPQVFKVPVEIDQNNSFLRAADLQAFPQCKVSSFDFFSPEHAAEEFPAGVSGTKIQVHDDSVVGTLKAVQVNTGLQTDFSANSDLDWESQLPLSGPAITSILRNHAFMNIRSSPGYFSSNSTPFGLSATEQEPEGFVASLVGPYASV